MPRSDHLPYVVAGPSRPSPAPNDVPEQPKPVPARERDSTPQPNAQTIKPPVGFTPPKRQQVLSVKGKERAEMGALGEEGREGMVGAGGGVVCWKHLLSGHTIGPGHPLRAIVHIDIDAAYAGMEMSRLGIPWDSDVPLCVQQWQGLIAVNYPARKFGITRHESPASALEKCPELRMVHCATYGPGDTEPNYNHENPQPGTHKISLDFYRQESLKIVAVFREHADVVQKASIDESYLDLSLRARALLLQRHPVLRSLPDNASLEDELPSPASFGIRVDWDEIGNTVPIPGEGAGKKEPTWPDVALALAAELAAEARKDVLTKLGYTCSAGIAPNKMLAKLGSGFKKPNAQTILRPAAVASFIGPMPFQKIGRLGGKLGDTVRELFPAESVDELLKVDLEEMQDKLGEETGLWVWEIVRGVDATVVEAKTAVASQLASKNFRPSICKLDEITAWLHILCTELLHRLTESRELRPGLWPKTLHFSWRPPFTYLITKSHQAPFPFTKNLTTEYIFKRASTLLTIALAAGGKDTKEGRQMVVGNMALAFNGLEERESGQAGIDGFFRTREEDKYKLAPAVKRVRADVDEGEEQEPDATKPKLEQNLAPRSPSPEILSFTCQRCKKTIPVDATCTGSEQERLSRAEAEHADFHFARDLLEGERAKERERVPLKKLGKTGSGSGSALGTGKAKVKVGSGSGGAGGAKGKREGGQQSLAGFFTKK